MPGTKIYGVSIDLFPWMIDIGPFTTPGTYTDWSTIDIDSGAIGNATIRTDGTQNALISWPVVLAAGTWTVSLIHCTNVANGIYSVQFDGVEKGTIDGYSNPAVKNVISTVTGITVATTAKITIMLKMATKNGASAGYYGYIQAMRIIRTA
jgi:hypothetical protein